MEENDVQKKYEKSISENMQIHDSSYNKPDGIADNTWQFIIKDLADTENQRQDLQKNFIDKWQKFFNDKFMHGLVIFGIIAMCGISIGSIIPYEPMSTYTDVSLTDIFAYCLIADVIVFAFTVVFGWFLESNPFYILAKYFFKKNVICKILKIIEYSVPGIKSSNKKLISLKTIKDFGFFQNATSENVNMSFINSNPNNSVFIQTTEIKLLNVKQFQGYALMFKSDILFNSHTIIKQHINNSVEKVHKIASLNLKKIDFQTEGYNEIYDIYSDNEVEAKELFNTKFVKCIQALRIEVNAEYMVCSFYKNNVLILFSTNGDMFQLGNINYPVNLKYGFYKFYKPIMQINQFIKNLKSQISDIEIEYNESESDTENSIVDSIFYDKIKPKLPELEQIRLNLIHNIGIKSKIYLTLNGISFTVLFIIRGLVKTSRNLHVCGLGKYILICLGIVILLNILASYFTDKVERKYFQLIMKKIFSTYIAQLVDKLAWTNKNIISGETIYDKCGLNTFQYIKPVDDAFVGTMSGIPVAIQELDLKLELYSKDKMRGIAIALTVGNNYKSHTIVKQRFGQRIRPFAESNEHLEKVVLEDIEFNKKYEVYSSDQIEARYLLNPVFMEKISGIQELYKAQFVELAIYKGNILLLLNTENSIFDFNYEELYYPFYNHKTSFNSLYYDLKSVKDFVEYLKLNIKK